MNELEMTLTLTRKDVCDLLLACLAADDAAGGNAKKWDKLHNNLKKQLNAFDEAHPIEL